MNVQFNDCDICISDLGCASSKVYSALMLIIVIIILIIINIHCIKHSRIRENTDKWKSVFSHVLCSDYHYHPNKKPEKLDYQIITILNSIRELSTHLQQMLSFYTSSKPLVFGDLRKSKTGILAKNGFKRFYWEGCRFTPLHRNFWVTNNLKSA